MITLNIVLELQSSLHIGGEVRQNTNATLPMLKTPEGLPYIPATSMKGRLRDEVERLLRAQSLTICDAPRPETMCRPLAGQVACPVCQLFGSPWQEASLYFNDLHLLPEHQQMFHGRIPRTTAHVSVRMNRRRRVVEDQALFDTELFQPGYPWKFQANLVYTHNSLIDLAPVLLAAKGIRMIGKARSRGLGWCSVNINEGDESLNLRNLWDTWSKRV